MIRTFLRAHIDVVRENDQLHRDYRTLAAESIHKNDLIEALRDELSQARADASLVALMVPRERRREALEFVKARHWIDGGLEGLDEVEP